MSAERSPTHKTLFTRVVDYCSNVSPKAISLTQRSVHCRNRRTKTAILAVDRTPTFPIVPVTQKYGTGSCGTLFCGICRPRECPEMISRASRYQSDQDLETPESFSKMAASSMRAWRLPAIWGANHRLAPGAQSRSVQRHGARHRDCRPFIGSPSPRTP